MFDVAIIGAGMAGLTAADRLQAAGWRTVVLEKSRGAGGRMSTRRDGELRFDHGAQYFTARDRAFVTVAAHWRSAGLVSQWTPRLGVIDENAIAPKSSSPARYVGVPGMNTVCGELAESLADCRYEWHVGQLERREATGWRLHASGGEVDARSVLVTIPAPQCVALLKQADIPVPARVADVHMDPCWALLACFDRPALREYDAAFVNSGPLSWVAAQRSRAERPPHDAWVLHAGPEWSRANLELSRDAAADALLNAARLLPGADPGATALSVRAHRWRYSIAREPLTEGPPALEDGSVVLAGDWTCGSRVEGAWRSGVAAVAALERYLHGSRGGQPD